MKKEEKKKRHEMRLNAWHEFVFKHIEIATTITSIAIAAIGGGIYAMFEHFVAGLYPNARNVLSTITVIVIVIANMHLNAIWNQKFDEMLVEFTERIEANNTSDETE